MTIVQSPSIIRSSIKVLPPAMAEKIAAGEVIERPSSVIKELIENSIDAQAKTIKVAILEGGLKSITITDDGFGIADDEAKLALQRHATSKIQSLEDLYSLNSMGFRGEALPSIAAISRLNLETRARGLANQHGQSLYYEGSTLLKEQPQVAADFWGTRITVSDLFYNVPARLKFQKTKNSETSQIKDLIERIAIIYPDVEFALTSDDRKLLLLKRAPDLATRVSQVFQTKPDALEPLVAAFDDIQIRAWLDHNSRLGTSKGIYLSINHRMVKDKLLYQAVLSALRPRMMEGEYPKIYIELTIAPEKIDVNVHPAKQEVRFERSKDVFQLLFQTLSKSASTSNKIAYQVNLPQNLTREPVQPSFLSSEPVIMKNKQLWVESDLNKNYLFSDDRQTSEAPQLTQVPEPANAPAAESFLSLHYIGQLKNTYLLFQDNDGLVIIDQHAAHERINYEKVKNDFRQQGLQAQPLLIPAVLKCTEDQVAIAQENQNAFQKLGFEFEVFSATSLLIRSAPEGVAAGLVLELFQQILAEANNGENDLATLVANPNLLSLKLERVLATTACHASIRAGQALAREEAIALVRQMQTTESALNCPHGRPASIKLTHAQIEGLFKRG